jgi:hypothetical protein
MTYGFGPGDLFHEEGHVLNNSTTLQLIDYTFWLREAIPELSNDKISEYFTLNPPSNWNSKWNFSLNDQFISGITRYVTDARTWGKPLSKLDKTTPQIRNYGLLFMINLNKELGDTAYQNMMTDFNAYLRGSNFNTSQAETKLEEYALKYAANQSNITKLFNDWVFVGMPAS